MNVIMELFPFEEKLKNEIHKMYNTSDAEVATSIQMISDWLKLQPHMPRDLPALFEDSRMRVIRSCLLHEKFSSERAKLKLDTHFTLRTINRDLYEVLAEKDAPLPSQLSIEVLPLPKTGPSLERIYVVRFKDPNEMPLEPDHFVKSALVASELAAHCDYTAGCRVIFDCANYTFKNFKRTDLGKFVRLSAMIIQAYSSRVVAIHVLNSLPFTSYLVAAVKTCLHQKILDRIKFHSDMDSFYDEVPKEYLPEEYGGKSESLKEIAVIMDKVFDQHRTFWHRSLDYEVNESLRVGKSNHDVMFGTEGSFKKLSID